MAKTTKASAVDATEDLPYVSSIRYLLKGAQEIQEHKLKPLTAIVGPVEIGKTTLLDAVRIALSLENYSGSNASKSIPYLTAKGMMFVAAETPGSKRPFASVDQTRVSARKWEGAATIEDDSTQQWLPGLELSDLLTMGPELLRRRIFDRFGQVKPKPLARLADLLVTAEERQALTRIIQAGDRADGVVVEKEEDQEDQEDKPGPGWAKDPAQVLVQLLERAGAAMRAEASVGRQFALEVQKAREAARGAEAGPAPVKKGKKGEKPAISPEGAALVLASPGSQRLCPKCRKELDVASKTADAEQVSGLAATRDLVTLERLQRESEIRHKAVESIKKLAQSAMDQAEEVTFAFAEEAVNKFLPGRIRAKIVKVERGIQWALYIKQTKATVGVQSLSGWQRGCLALAIPLAFRQSDPNNVGVPPVILLDDLELAGMSATEVYRLLEALRVEVINGNVRQVIVTRHDDRASEIPNSYHVVRLE